MSSSPPDAPVIVMDIGGTNIRVGSVTRSGSVTIGAVVSADRLRDGDPVAALAALVRSQLAETAVPAAGIVVGVPGFMDAARRTVINTPNIASLAGVPLASRLEAFCGVPVWLEHDAALLTRGEWVNGSGLGADLVLGVYLGTGIGAAFLKGGRPMKGGAYGMQLGHIAARGDGRRCSCGGIDCIEAYASGLVLQDIARGAGVPIEHVFAERRASPDLDRALAQKPAQ
jgi:allose kinase